MLQFLTESYSKNALSQSSHTLQHIKCQAHVVGMSVGTYYGIKHMEHAEVIEEGMRKTFHKLT